MNAIENFNAVTSVLLGDVQACQAQLTELMPKMLDAVGDPKVFPILQYQQQFWCRCLIRALYALIEGTTYSLKQIAYTLRDRPSEPFTVGELAMMQEESYEIKDNGNVRIIKARLRFENNFRFAIKVYARATGLPNSFDLGTQGWEALVFSISVRDRLMHPKEYKNLVFTDDEITKMLYAFVWFGQAMQQLLQSLVEQQSDFPALFPDYPTPPAPAPQ